MDFSYPEGKTYARGTYIYPYFGAKSLRTSPLESQFFSFLLRNQNIVKEYENGYIRYTTKPMISYKNRLEKASADFKARLIAAPGKGVPLSLPFRDRTREERMPLIFAAGKSGESWESFLKTYRLGIKNLPSPKEPVMDYLRNLSPKERDIWTTLLPSAAAVKREHLGDKRKGVDILALVKDWAIAVIDRTLS